MPAMRNQCRYQGKDLLSAFGLSTVPAWLKPYEVLSTGESLYLYSFTVGRCCCCKAPLFQGCPSQTAG